MRRLKLALPFVALAGLAVLAWPRAGGGSGDELVLVSPHWEGIQEEFTWGFQDHWKARTGRTVHLTWLDLGGTGKCVQYVRSRKPEKLAELGADVFFGGGVDPFIEFARDGYLQPVELPAETLAAIPAKVGGYPLRDEGNRWFSACLSNFGMVFNRPVLRELRLPEPREWEDLADPRFFQWLGFGEPRSSGTVRMTYELILQSYGWERGWALVTRIGGNVRSFPEGGNGIPRDTALGQFAAGGAVDFYALEKVYRLGSDCMGFAAPRRLPVINGDPVGVLTGAPHREAAEEFARFALSAQGQRLWCLAIGSPGGPRKFGLGRLPVRPDVYAAAPPEIAAENPFKMDFTSQYDLKKGSRRARPLEQFLGAAIIDAHDELRAAWKALIDAGLPAEGLAELGAPPCSEEEFLEIADRLWKAKDARDSDRNAQIAAWGKWARAKYAAIRKKYGR
jgi:ABC-type Fe3+ transport system substrate-binding protein